MDKKRILRCLVEDVTLDASDSEIFIGIRFKGGMLESMAVKRPPKKYETWTKKPEIYGIYGFLKAGKYLGQ